MKRASRIARWAAGSLAAVPVAMAGLGTPATAGAVLVILIVVTALCWIIKDANRSRHLAMLISACHGGNASAPGLPQPDREAHDRPTRSPWL